ncbi:hypothetical protein [Haloarchaeobius iranensis]|uniref:Uncharacterized protein n=1 Tax=Haloarchaeobius iranensis TaxID=996166 RepID=A0A1G9XBJ2_9EURY|nr:hypothetical protein [Haloarchaeobius iranensis]SDM94047.1 hypothetical protein SAMN05192554_11026 [Haloarchaeobius iranensis]
MAVHSEPTSGDGGPQLPPAVPFTLQHLSRLSWELGSRVVDDGAATREGVWERADGGWRLSVYRVTSATDVLCVRSPTGRERFYGTPRSSLETARRRLAASADWRRSR